MLPLSHVPGVEARAVGVSLGVGAALMAVKFFAYFLTGSAAIFSDALESIVNVAAAGFALYAIYYAHLPADENHPYGHGKIEFLSAGFEGGMILLAALAAAVNAVYALMQRTQLQHAQLNLGLLLVAAALVINGALGLHLVRTGKRQGSIALVADGKHLLSDAITSVVALGGLAVVRITHWWWADPVAALAVSAYIARMGLGLVRHSLDGLLDKQDAQDVLLLRNILDAHVDPKGQAPHICGYHKLRHRHSGRFHWVDFHIEVPAAWDVERGHQVASAIEHEIQQALGEGNATAHIEPCRRAECGWCAVGQG